MSRSHTGRLQFTIKYAKALNVLKGKEPGILGKSVSPKKGPVSQEEKLGRAAGPSTLLRTRLRPHLSPGKASFRAEAVEPLPAVALPAGEEVAQV